MSFGSPTGYEQLRPADAALVDAICDRFESAWKGVSAEGAPPGIQPYLAGQPDSVQSVLARELIALDRAYRERRGETLTADRYLNLLSDWEDGRDQEPSPGGNWPELPGLQIVKVLGVGGMGVVYKAWQPALDRYVAVKMLRHADLADAEHRQRFAREARAVAQLQHPQMVQIFAIGELPGAAPLPYFVMEFVGGGNLADTLRGHPQPPRAAAQLLETLARALHYAHQQGIVHRDLKPGNVLIQKSGGVEKKNEGSPDSPPQFASLQPKITDFGLAKLGIGSDLTQTGDTLGTPSYMAPEQTDGKSTEVSPLTDVYGLGAIFYETLTGRPPFQADTALATILQVRHDEPVSPRRLQPTVPPELETICLKCLQKSPKERYSSSESLAEDLRRFQEGRPILARPVSTGQRVWKWIRRRPAAAGLVAVSGLATALLLVVLLVSNIQIRRQQQETKVALDAERLTLYFHRIRLAQAALQGNNTRQAETYLQACLPEPDQRDLRGWEWYYLQRQCHTELISFEGHTDGVRRVVFLDGNRVASFGADGLLQVWNSVTGEIAWSRTILPKAQQWYVAFSPDAKLLAVGDAATGVLKIHAVADGKDLYTFRGCRPIFSADSRRLASIDVPPKQAWIYDLTTGKELRICPLPGNANSAYAFRGDGLWEAAVNPDRTIRVWNVESGEEQFTGRGQSVGNFFPYFSRDGRWLATAGEDGTIKIWDAVAGQERTTIHAHVGNITSLAFSPDHQQLASADLSGSVKVWDLQGNEIRVLPGHGVVVGCLEFSRDGRLLASTGADWSVKIWDIGKDSTAVVFRQHKSYVTSMGFSPDGRHIVSAGFDQTLKTWDAATGKILFDLPGGMGIIRYAAFSKDGRRFRACNGTAAVREWDSATAKEVNFRQGMKDVSSTAIVVSPGGAFIASPETDNLIMLRDAPTGEILHQLRGHTARVSMARFSPDDRLLASASDDKTVKVWDTETGREICTYRGHTGNVLCVAFNADGLSIASGGRDNSIHLWDARTGKELRTFDNTWGRVVNTLVISPDGRRLASGSFHAAVSLWDTDTGQEVLEIPTGRTIATSIMFSPEGRRLAAVCNDGTVVVWDGPTPASAGAAFGIDDSTPMFGESLRPSSTTTTIRLRTDSKTE